AVTCYECDSVNDLYCGVDDFQSNDIAKTDCDAMELPQADQPVIYLERPETACLTKYYKDPAAADASFVRRSCAFGDLTACDTQPDPVMPQLGFLGC
ncbi:CG14401, partial [Drosophila busckii]